MSVETPTRVSRGRRARKKSFMLDSMSPNEMDKSNRVFKCVGPLKIDTNMVGDVVVNDDGRFPQVPVANTSTGMVGELAKIEVPQSLHVNGRGRKRMHTDGEVVAVKKEGMVKRIPRATAYNVWKRELSATSQFDEIPDLGSANASPSFREQWAKLSSKEKGYWRRMAKQETEKARAQEAVHVWAAPPSLYAYTHANRTTTSRTSKLATMRTEAVKQTQAVPPKGTLGNSHRSAVSAPLAKHPRGTSCYTISQASHDAPVTSIEPINLAAHFKQLGENLSAIGERVKQNNGPESTPEDLSMLLDSLLCTMGPILSLTTYIPVLQNDMYLKQKIANTRDNIAHVMSGE